MSQPSISRVDTNDRISWHVERRGTGPDVVLIPSGEGDCESFAKTAAILATSFAVTTFDMPGMSRTTAPEAAMQDITTSKLAHQIIGLLNVLKIEKATFWGCSSGGLIALCLASQHTNRVRNTIIHEVPLASGPAINALKSLSDADIVSTCHTLFTTTLCEDPAKFEALGPTYNDRLKKNLVTWVRRYVNQVERGFSKEELRSRPVCWTIGALTPAGMFLQNVVVGVKAGIEVGSLECRHFPQITVPEALAEHIRRETVKYLP